MYRGHSCPRLLILSLLRQRVKACPKGQLPLASRLSTVHGGTFRAVPSCDEIESGIADMDCNRETRILHLPAVSPHPPYDVAISFKTIGSRAGSTYPVARLDATPRIATSV